MTDMDVWAQCQPVEPVALQGHALRLVESQEQIATHSLVDTLDEQAILEALLDRSKPPVATDHNGLHYLLFTPFRYPPLKHGSRFGQRHEPSLFYGSLSEFTVLAEAAYYRLIFWYGMVVPPTVAYTTQHSLIGFDYATMSGLRLQNPPFTTYRTALIDPAHYGVTQQLGTQLRQAGIQAFEYVSARDRNGGLNVALFTVAALDCQRPTFVEQWLCETSGEAVCYYRNKMPVTKFLLADFMVNGVLPTPAL